MSVSVKWQAVNGKLLASNPKSSFCEAMERAGFNLPIELTVHAIPTLRGIAAGDPHLEDAIEELIEALAAHDVIRVWGEW